MRRLAALLALVAVAVAGGAVPAAQAKGPAHPSKRYCKKHAKHLTKKQRKWCKRKRHTTSSHSAPTTPAGPLTQAPAAPPIATQPPATGTGTPTAPTTTVPVARMAVSAKEYSLTLSRTQLPAGDAIVELQNNGEDPHNLRIEPLAGGAPVRDFSDTGPGQLNKQRLTLVAGSYKLLCTLGSHDSLGMHATLTVAP